MEELERELTQLIQNNPLPWEVKRYVVKHVFTLVDDAYKIKALELQIPPKESEVKTDE